MDPIGALFCFEYSLSKTFILHTQLFLDKVEEYLRIFLYETIFSDCMFKNLL